VLLIERTLSSSNRFLTSSVTLKALLRVPMPMPASTVVLSGTTE
jgi:hypothetical protein